MAVKDHIKLSKANAAQLHAKAKLAMRKKQSAEVGKLKETIDALLADIDKTLENSSRIAQSIDKIRVQP